MTPNENCLRNLIGYLGTLIGECSEAIASAFREMEKFNISSEDFRKESLKLNTAAFTLGYLERIRNMAEETDYKTSSDYIRFCKQQLEARGSGETDAIKVAQVSTISVLSSIIRTCLDK